MDTPKSAPQVDRRRVLQGVAWATPAVLIATAAPSFAASPPVKGQLAIINASAAMNTANFFVTATVVYGGDGAPHADYPVSAVTLAVTLPTNRVVAGTPGVTSLEWSYVGAVAAGANTTYTFSYNGAALSATNPVTPQVTVRIPATASLAAVTIPVVANGISNSAGVVSPTALVTAVVGANLVVDNAATDFINWMPNGSGGIQNGYRMQGVGRWAGPYFPIGANITNLLMVIRIPAANTDGTYRVLQLGAGWSLSQAPVLSNNVWQAAWVYAPTIGTANPSTTGWDIAFKALGAKQLNVVSSALYGQANGSPNYFAWAGPAS